MCCSLKQGAQPRLTLSGGQDLDHHHEKGLVTVKHNAHSCDLTSGMWGVCSELEQYISVELDVVDTAHKLREEECYPLWYKQANY